MSKASEGGGENVIHLGGPDSPRAKKADTPRPKPADVPRPVVEDSKPKIAFDQILKEVPPAHRAEAEKIFREAPENQRDHVLKAISLMGKDLPKVGTLEGLRASITQFAARLGRGGEKIIDNKVLDEKLAGAKRVIEEAKAKQAATGKPISANELLKMMRRGVKDVSIVRPMATYSNWWIARPIGEGLFGTLDVLVLSYIFQFVARAVNPTLEIGIGTPAHYVAMMVAVVAVVVNAHSKMKVLKSLAEGKDQIKTKKTTKQKIKAGAGAAVRAGVLTAVVWGATSSQVKIPSSMWVSKETAGVLGVPSQKFSESLATLRARQPLFGTAVRAIEDFSMNIEVGRWDEGKKQYVDWTEGELKVMRESLQQALREAQFTEKEIAFYSSVSGSQKAGKGKFAAFREMLFTGVFDEVRIRASRKAELLARNVKLTPAQLEAELDKTVKEIKTFVEAAQKARKDAGIGENERLSDAVIRIMNAFFEGDEMKRILVINTSIEKITATIKAQGEDLTAVLWNMAKGAPPNDVKSLAPLLEELRAQKAQIEKLSKEKVGTLLVGMFSTLDKVIQAAKIPGALALKPPPPYSVDVSALNPLDKLLRESGIAIATRSIEEEAKREFFDWVVVYVQRALHGFKEEFWIRNEEVQNAGKLFGQFAGKDVGEHIQKYGMYDAIAASIALVFFATMISIPFVKRRSRQIREAEVGAREELSNNEEEMAQQFADILNIALEKITGGKGKKIPPVTPDMVNVAMRVLRDMRNPHLEGERSLGGSLIAGLGEVIQKGPVPEFAQRNLLFRQMLEDLKQQPGPAEKFFELFTAKYLKDVSDLTEIILPGIFDALQAENDFNKAAKQGKEKKARYLLALRDKFADYVKLGHIKFKIGLLEARQRAYFAEREKLTLIKNPEQRAAILAYVKNPIDMLSSKEIPDFSLGVAIFLSENAAVQHEAFRISEDLEQLKREAAEIAQNMAVVFSDPKNPAEIPEAFVIGSPRTADSYSVQAAVNEYEAEKIRRNKEEGIEQTSDAAGFAKLKLTAVRDSAILVEKNFRRDHPNFDTTLTYVFNEERGLMEFHLLVRDKAAGNEVVLDTIHEDDLLDPAFSSRDAVDRMRGWVIPAIAPLRTMQRSASDTKLQTETALNSLKERMKKFLVPREVREAPIELSGKNPEGLQAAMQLAVSDYFRDIKALEQLKKAKEYNLDDPRLDAPTLLKEIAKIENIKITDIERHRVKIPRRGRVVDVCKLVLARKDIPQSCAIRYDLKYHRVTVSDVKTGFRSYFRFVVSTKPDVHIKVGVKDDDFTLDKLEAAIAKFS